MEAEGYDSPAPTHIVLRLLSCSYRRSLAVRGRLSVKFFDIVNQAIALLQNAERISHRALKREFDLTQETVWRLLSKGLKYGTI